MSAKSNLDLTDLTVAPIEVMSAPAGLTLESVVAGHVMTEVGASVIGSCPIALCSCCCCC